LNRVVRTQQGDALTRRRAGSTLSGGCAQRPPFILKRPAEDAADGICRLDEGSWRSS